MTDQKQMWNEKHAAKQLAFGVKPLPFALSIINQIGHDDIVLELGCGMGGDAKLFAEHGAKVTATDFSDVVVADNQQRFGNDNPTYVVMDTSGTFPFADASFTVVYSHLALHYWNQNVTANVFAEIARVLKPGGKLFFACKSVKDPLFGQGNEVESGVFSRDGHVRHFFSVEYTRELLSPDFTISKLSETSAQYAGEDSAFIHCWAVRK